ncbi:hypothetical protein [Bacillus sp. M6-12]|uniref:hypothetical protein n=1 Tax=Bacillus sp. M6-12 TaxID=2054166 RepID=UPI0015E07378|nr:hypothetical protein [Bacillus sp. M6-12]
MKSELLHVLTNMSNPDTMKTFVLNMNFETREQFFSLLSFVDETTQEKWIDMFSTL